MKETINTGGEKSFVYDGKERYDDNKHTFGFKEEYNKWINRPFYKRKLFWILLFLLILIYLLIQLF